MEGVVDDAEAVLKAQFPDRLDRLGLVAQRTGPEAQGLDQPDQALGLEQRRQFRQRPAQVGAAFLGRHAQAVVSGDQADHPRPAGPRDGGKRGGLVVLGRGPVVERLHLGEGEDAQARGGGGGAHVLGGRPVEQRAVKVVAELDADTAKPLRQLEELDPVEPGRGHVVQRTVQHRRSPFASPRRAAVRCGRLIAGGPPGRYRHFAARHRPAPAPPARRCRRPTAGGPPRPHRGSRRVRCGSFRHSVQGRTA
jgi:hypothetical protein